MKPCPASLAALAAVLLLLAIRCSSAEPPATSPTTRGDDPAAAPASQPAAVLGLDPGWTLVPGAQYTASQTPSEVILKAIGQNPTAGYQTRLVPSPLRIWPPQHLLAHKKPDGMSAQVITPFEVSASFKSTDPVKTVIITDAAGRHEVQVDQARD